MDALHGITRTELEQPRSDFPQELIRQERGERFRTDEEIVAQQQSGVTYALFVEQFPRIQVGIARFFTHTTPFVDERKVRNTVLPDDKNESVRVMHTDSFETFIPDLRIRL